MGITAIIIVIIQAIIAPLLIWGITEGVKFLKIKAETIVDTDIRQKAQHYIDLASQAIQTAVAETQQTFVSTIKDTPAWSAATAQEALARARDRALEIMSASAQSGLQEAVGDVNKWITAKIEESVLNTKAASVPAPAPAPVLLEGAPSNA